MAIYSWFSQLQNGDFPVRYVNVYQRVDDEDTIWLKEKKPWHLPSGKLT